MSNGGSSGTAPTDFRNEAEHNTRSLLTSKNNRDGEEAYVSDAFGTGTAATISHISIIGVDGEDMVLPPVSERGFSNKVQDYLSKLKVGEAEDYMSWMTKA